MLSAPKLRRSGRAGRSRAGSAARSGAARRSTARARLTSARDLADALADLAAIQAGQHHVEDDDVGLLAHMRRQSVYTVIGADDDETSFHQVEAHQSGDVRIIFDNQRLEGCRLRLPARHERATGIEHGRDLRVASLAQTLWACAPARADARH